MSNENLNIKTGAVTKTNTIPNSKIVVPIINCPENVPSLPIGKCTYYADRNSSFIERRPNKKPPTYYLNYGFKYCSKFKAETYSKLTSEGQIWLNKTLKFLQVYMEQGLVQKNYVSTLNEDYNTRYSLENIYENGKIVGVQETVKEFYKGIECREKEFKDFAFATHPDAYRPKDLEDLSIFDLWHIANTPDIEEFFDKRTWEQILIMYKNMDVSQIILKGSKEISDSIYESVSTSISNSINSAEKVLDGIFK